ncbi:PREDICTED: uncharacterized protein LOC109182659 [Ipomoea nil]|uniref:uncharacterized protein LOC109182659 n=1 Tax=Ipomoea nil TaxID=35883 RepID=UPI000901BC42|nr:PREDICTED: uncharacterized protein LOC109182659 [Ipomoea nil]
MACSRARELQAVERNRESSPDGLVESWGETPDVQIEAEGRKDRPTTQSPMSTNPFSIEIQEYRISKDFECQAMPAFDGTSDPDDHLNNFRTRMRIIGAGYPMCCHTFFLTLSGAAQQWFTSLPPQSINCFRTLAKQFLTHFAGNIRDKKYSIALTSVQQEELETLKNFLKRWQEQIQIAEGLDDRTALTLFMEALRSGDLPTSLRRKNPETYAQAIQWAHKYADAEEALRQKRKRKEERPCKDIRTHLGDRPSEKKNKSSVHKEPINHCYRAVPELGSRPAYNAKLPRHTSATSRPLPPLSQPINWSLYMKPTTRGPKYCRYHRKAGHTTEECTTLQKEIGNLIHRGRQATRPNQWSRQLTEPAEDPVHRERQATRPNQWSR